MGVFDKSNYIVNTLIIEQFSASEMTYIVSSGALNSTHSLTIEQFFQCTTKMILLAKMIKLWSFYENVVHS